MIRFFLGQPQGKIIIILCVLLKLFSPCAGESLTRLRVLPFTTIYLATTTYDDSDSDLIPDLVDDCITDFNPEQLDEDFDGVGDICDIEPLTYNLPNPPCEIIFECAFDEQCSDNDPCSLDTCVEGICFNEFDPNACQRDCYISNWYGDDVQGNGTDIEPWKTFAMAIQNNCTTILVDPGVYDGPENRNLNVSYCIDIVKWEEGFYGIGDVVIDLQRSGRFLSMTGKSDGSISYMDSITYKNGETPDRGGVLKVTKCDLIISTCSFSDSSSGQDGGAIAAFSSSIINIIIVNSSFIGNVATGFSKGGAISLVGDPSLFFQSDLITIDVLFFNNTAYSGGAVWIDRRAVANFYNSEFDSNRASPLLGGPFPIGGGAIFVEDLSFIETVNSTFSNNTAGIAFLSNGGAILSDITSTQLHRGSTFCSNSAFGSGSQSGGAIWGYDYQLIQFSGPIDSIFQSNIADDSPTINVGPNIACSTTPFCYEIPLIVSQGNCLTIEQLPPNPALDDCFVSQVIGSDSFGDGSLFNPFATIRHALDLLCARIMLFPDVFDDFYGLESNRNLEINYGVEIFHSPLTGPGKSTIDLQHRSRFAKMIANPDLVIIHDVDFINGYSNGPSSPGGTLLVVGKFYTRTSLEIYNVSISDSISRNSLSSPYYLPIPDDGDEDGLCINCGGAIAVVNGNLVFNSSVILRSLVGEISSSELAFPNITDQSDGKGGAICIIDTYDLPLINQSHSPSVISSSVFGVNIASSMGGGVALVNQTMIIIDSCEFLHNIAFNSGGGLFSQSTELLQLDTSIFSGNIATMSGGAIFFGDSLTSSSPCDGIQVIDVLKEYQSIMTNNSFCNNIAWGGSIDSPYGYGGGYARNSTGENVTEEFVGSNFFQCNAATLLGTTDTSPQVELPCYENPLNCFHSLVMDLDPDGRCDLCTPNTLALQEMETECMLTIAIILDASSNVPNFPQYLGIIRDSLIVPLAGGPVSIALYSYSSISLIEVSYMDLRIGGNLDNLLYVLENIDQHPSLGENWASVFDLVSISSPGNTPDFVLFFPYANPNLPITNPMGDAIDAIQNLVFGNGNSTRVISFAPDGVREDQVSGPNVFGCSDVTALLEFGPENNTAFDHLEGFDYFHFAYGANFSSILSQVLDLQLCCPIATDQCGICDGNNTLCLVVPCDDGNACTLGDSCIDGVCAGVLRTCDDDNTCTIDTCDPELGCLFTPNINGTCSDDNLCTIDTCSESGDCISSPVICEDDGNPCTDELCNSLTGSCQIVNNSRLCNDANMCSRIDVCSGGECVGMDIIDCNCGNVTLNNPCLIGECNPLNGECLYSPVEDTTPCPDADLCTLDVCVSGQCVHVPLNCSDQNYCTLDYCQGGICLHNNVDIPCDDGNFCTTQDRCQNGICSGIPNDCLNDGFYCNGFSTCNQETSSCDFTPVLCDDFNPCTDNVCSESNDTCVFPPIALVGTQCGTNIGTCEFGQYVCIPVGEDPVLFCVGGVDPIPEQCGINGAGDLLDNNCNGETDENCGIICSSASECPISVCRIRSCVNNTCTYDNSPQGTPCDDLDACTVNDQCDNGICVGTPRVFIQQTSGGCNDSNPCTDDQCFTSELSISGFVCANIDNNNRTCDDGFFCTVSDMCTNGDCSGIPRECNSDGPCTRGVCDEFTKQCVLVGNSTASCDDQNICTLGDFCTPLGECSYESLMNCDDSNPCTDDLCDSILGCLHIANNSNICNDGNLCTLDVCFSGSCISSPIICEPLNQCYSSSCDNTTGMCQQIPKINGTLCEDGIPCTQDDVCISGWCVGTLKNCTDSNLCTYDYCESGTGICVSIPLLGEEAASTLCDDGSLCTNEDRCQSGTGVCLGSPIVCNDTNACTSDTCNPQSGQCVFIPTSNNTCSPASFCYGLYGSPCDDGNPCTLNDTCIEGLCIGTLLNCTDNNECTTDYCATNTGECVHFYDNQQLCDDNNQCTIGDHCLNGDCIPGELLTCNDLNLCTSDACNPFSGECFFSNNTISCDDGNLCTTDDQCFNGVCSGIPLLCEIRECSLGFCDTEIGICIYENLQDDTECDDGNACTIGDVCFMGVCVGEPKNCSDSNPCTDDVCLENGDCRSYNNNTNPCDDGILCTIGDACDNGECKGIPVICPSLNDCIAGYCNQTTGLCQTMDNTVSCDDGDACTLNDKCNGAGACIGIPKNCNDLQPCTLDSCDSDTGDCIHVPLANFTTCADGNLCTIGDICIGGICKGLEKDCQDGNVCTSDFCDPETGQCIPINNMLSCNDGNPCTYNDTCLEGTCIGNNTLACDDQNPCTEDICVLGNVQTQNTPTCSHINISGVECDDGIPCTKNDTCSAGICSGTLLNCDDGNVCTNNFCDELTGLCISQNEGSICDDGDPCTIADSCVNGTCLGVPLNCDDSNPCTLDQCDPLSSTCENFPYATSQKIHCDDGDSCTFDDYCVNVCDGKKRWLRAGNSCGVCMGTPKNCSDGNPCTLDMCDSQTGACETIQEMEGQLCDDQNPCTLFDRCVRGLCLGLPKTCDDLNSCTLDSCNVTNGDCSNIPDDFLNCTDGNACTLGDHCFNGTCNYNHTLNCDDGNACTTDECDESTGSCIPTNHLGECDDSDPCTLNDTCNENGHCSGILIDCDDGDQCTFDVCFDGLCLHACGNGMPCDDGNLCTINDTCVDRVCIGIDVICSDGNPCTLDECDSDTGSCLPIPNPYSIGCDDSNPCTYDDTCILGQCYGTPVVCVDGNPCTSDQCVGGICFFSNLLALPCDDGDLCTLNDTCRLLPIDEGVSHCRGDPIICGDENPCQDNPCVNGICTPIDVDNPCDDGDACTDMDHCYLGNCIGTTRVCDDQNPCTLDFCIEGVCLTGNLENGTQCDDGDHCTFDDICVNGVCGGTQITCNSEDPCFVSMCLDGMCIYEYNNQNQCDDGNPCTLFDSCLNGTCQGTPMNCTDNNQCTEDHCISGECTFIEVGCGVPCDDGDLCTIYDECRHGVCYGNPKLCDLDNVCSQGGCDSQTGNCTTSQPDIPLECDDGDPCTIQEYCSQGECVGTTFVECDDMNPCTDDLCWRGYCYHRPMLGSSCNDGNNCTRNDTCVESRRHDHHPSRHDDDDDDDDDSNHHIFHHDRHDDDDDHHMHGWWVENDVEFIWEGSDCELECVGIPLECQHDCPACRTHECDPLTGEYGLVPDDSLCDDGDACTIHDKCFNGTCHGVPKTCTIRDIYQDDDDTHHSHHHNDDDDHHSRHEDDDDSHSIHRPQYDEGCTFMGCNPENGKCHIAFLSISCDDGDLCTIEDTCHEGECRGHPVNCDDHDACTTHDRCNPWNGECEHDLFECHCGDQCKTSSCVNEQVTIDPNDDDDDSQEIRYIAVCVERSLSGNIPCDDHDLCTTEDHCWQGHCGGYPIICNDDENPCTFGECDHETGLCQYSFTDDFDHHDKDDDDDDGHKHDDDDDEESHHLIHCDDGDACTHDDHCINGECRGYTITCDDHNECTDDSCDCRYGCVFTNNDNPCELCCDDDNDDDEIGLGDYQDGYGGRCYEGGCKKICLLEDGCEFDKFSISWTQKSCCHNHRDNNDHFGWGQFDSNTDDDDYSVHTKSIKAIPVGDDVLEFVESGILGIDDIVTVSLLVESDNDVYLFVITGTDGCESQLEMISNACGETSKILEMLILQGELRGDLLAFRDSGEDESQWLSQIGFGRFEWNWQLSQLDAIKYALIGPIPESETLCFDLFFITSENISGTAFASFNPLYQEHDQVKLIHGPIEPTGRLLHICRQPTHHHDIIFSHVPRCPKRHCNWDDDDNECIDIGLLERPLDHESEHEHHHNDDDDDNINHYQPREYSEEDYGELLLPRPIGWDHHEEECKSCKPEYSCHPPISCNMSLALSFTLRDFKNTHPNFGKDGTCLDDPGIVQHDIGNYGKPQYNGIDTPTTTGALDFLQWFRDIPTINKHTIVTLELLNIGSGWRQFDSNDFYPIDGALFGNQLEDHNRYFTLESHLYFIYGGGEQFSLGSYDDAWLFIHGVLVLDQGGCGHVVNQIVNLDSIAVTIGIELGHTYRLDIFVAERSQNVSRLHFSTNAHLENCFCLDECSVCNGEGHLCLGCDNIPYSGKQYDECGVCGGDGTLCECIHGRIEDDHCSCFKGWSGDLCDECCPGVGDKEFVCEYVCDDLDHHSDDDDDEHSRDCYKLLLTERSFAHHDDDDDDDDDDHGYDIINPGSIGKHGIYYDCMCKPEGFDYSCLPFDDDEWFTNTDSSSSSSSQSHSDSSTSTMEENNDDDDHHEDSSSHSTHNNDTTYNYYYSSNNDSDDDDDEAESLILLSLGLLIFLCCASGIVYGLWYCAKPDESEYMYTGTVVEEHQELFGLISKAMYGKHE